MVGAVGVVFLLSYLDLRREQARALDDFIGEQASLARSVAATMSARLALISRDLQAALAVPELEQSDAALRRIVELDGAYVELEVVEPSGNPMRKATSSAPDGARRHLRRFERTLGPRKAILSVDLDRLFADTNGTFRMPGIPFRRLVLDESGSEVELGAEGPESSNSDNDAVADISALRTRMSRGGDGAMLLGRTAAASMGLGQRLAVAGYAPISLEDGVRWSLAIVTSASRVRDRARFTAWRLGITTALASILVALFGSAVGRRQRREQEMAEALNLAEATAALRERSEKMIEVIPIGVLALDARQQVVSANPYLMARGIRPGLPLAQALPSASADERALLEALLVEARETHTPKERIGIVVHLATGERRDIDAYAIPLGRPLSDVDCFLVLHDRTAVRTLERSLVRAEKLATIGTLAAGVAHEMGTPLGIISGRAEQILARIPDGDAGEPSRKNVASILAQVDKVGTTIRQLLDFARVRSIKTEAVTPAQALGGAAALLEPHFRQAQVALDVEINATTDAVAADPGQLEQVLVNLLMNACDACAPAGHVWARARVVGDRVAIEISDDGSGIASEHLPMVMDPFFTTKKRGQGTGLGLSIAADIMKNHGGTLEIESVLGQGTTVRALLPRAPAPPEQRT